jgi:hypothetical protein
MEKKGVTTKFDLSANDIASSFGDINVKVPTWSHTRRAFDRAYKTGSAPVSLLKAEGKYSTGTSTLTVKFTCKVAGSNPYSWGDEDDYNGWLL